jgi:hypothetical protein
MQVGDFARASMSESRWTDPSSEALCWPMMVGVRNLQPSKPGTFPFQQRPPTLSWRQANAMLILRWLNQAGADLRHLTGGAAIIKISRPLSSLNLRHTEKFMTGRGVG